MVKVYGPLGSADAHGDLNKILNYHRRPGGHAVAKHHQPGSVVASHAEPSASQTTIRGYVAEAVSRWHDLSPAQRAQWDTYVAEA